MVTKVPPRHVATPVPIPRAVMPPSAGVPIPQAVIEPTVTEEAVVSEATVIEEITAPITAPFEIDNEVVTPMVKDEPVKAAPKKRKRSTPRASNRTPATVKKETVNEPGETGTAGSGSA